MDKSRNIIKTATDSFYRLFRQIDWKLLLFLILFLDVKLLVKCLAVIFMYVARPNFKFGLKLRFSRLPLFYIVIILLAMIDLFLYKLYGNLHYDLAFLTGAFFWLLCMLAIHQLKLAVETIDPVIIRQTLVVFFVINAFFSLTNVLTIILETGTLNPYLYQGQHQKYFIGTGDYIRGIFFDTSTTNAVMNAFGVVYFLSRKQMLMTLLCMSVLLLTGSNFCNLLLVAVLLGIFIFNSTRNQKSVIAVCIFLLVFFLARISPQNNSYAQALFKKVFNRSAAAQGAVLQPASLPVKLAVITSTESKRRQLASTYLDSLKRGWAELAPKQAQQKDPWVRPLIPQPDINGPEFQSRRDTTAIQKNLMAFERDPENAPDSFLMDDRQKNRPGKIIATEQTLHFLAQNPVRMVFGDGMGNFSSKLAYRTTALKIAGGYPEKYKYSSPEFLSNHLALFLYYFTKQAELHSMINMPDSTYDQLLSEYGVAGIVCFLLFYGWFFLKHARRLTYGIPLLVILMVIFGMGYWFEQLSVVPMFELLLFMDIKYSGEKILNKQAG